MAKSNQTQPLDAGEGTTEAKRQEGERQDTQAGSEEGSDKEARIRARAYDLWLEAGRPGGQQEEHWRRARQEIEAEEKARSEPPK